VPPDKPLDLCPAGGEGSSAGSFGEMNFMFGDNVPVGRGWVVTCNRRGCMEFSGNDSVLVFGTFRKKVFIGKNLLNLEVNFGYYVCLGKGS
jgi:hypothetical protein